jgi:hypothetical protein
VESNLKKVSPAIFALALICFLLPFVTFSCQGAKILTLSGIQLITGSSAQQPQMVGTPKSERIGGEPLAAFAFLCGILGLALSFLKGRMGAIASAAAGGIAAIFLLALKSKIDGDALNKGGGVLQVNYEIGFYAVVILLVAAMALNIFVLLQRSKAATP